MLIGLGDVYRNRAEAYYDRMADLERLEQYIKDYVEEHGCEPEIYFNEHLAGEEE